MIHNISIATDDDITYFGDTLHFYPGQLSFGDVVLIGKKRQLFQTIFFVHF